MTIRWRQLLASAVVALVSISALPMIAGPSAYAEDGDDLPPVEWLPDLKMARIGPARLERQRSGKTLLRFSTTVWNVGEGTFEVRGTNRDGSTLMTVQQWVKDDAGGHTVDKPEARMFFAGDGHRHWHVHSLVEMEIYQLDRPDRLRRTQKIGFCLTDVLRSRAAIPNKPPKAVYPYRGCGTTRTVESISMGISVGWGDIYPSTYSYQWIDVTGLPRGTYRLCATVNADGLWTEKADNVANNATWVDVRLNVARRTVRVIHRGRDECLLPD